MVSSKDIESAVFAWISEDAPLTVKMTLTRDITDKLIARIVEQLESDKDDSGNS